MTGAIVYCDQCGRMVPPSRWNDERTIVSGDFALCESCVESLSPEERAAVEKKIRRASRGSERRATPSSTTSRRTPPRTDAANGRASGAPRWLIPVTFGPGLIVGIVVALMFVGGETEQSVAVPAPPAAVPVVAVEDLPPPPPPRAQPAASTARASSSRLDRLRGMVDPELGKYDEVREELEAIVKENSGGPEAQRAREMLAEIDRKYAALADAALEKALAAASEMLAKNEPEAASSVLFSIRARFGYSEWYRTKGKARVAEAMEPIRKAIAKKEAEAKKAAESWRPGADYRRSSLTVGRDGMAYLTSGGKTQGKDWGHIIRVGLDGAKRRDQPADYAIHNATARADGTVASVHAHFLHKTIIYDRDFTKTGEMNDFLVSDQTGWDAPCHVEAGAGGDFYAGDQHRDRIVRISATGLPPKILPVPREPATQHGVIKDFRVCEKTSSFYVHSTSGHIRCVGFDGARRWSKQVRLAHQWYLRGSAFDVDDEGTLYYLEDKSDTVRRVSADGGELPSLKLRLAGHEPPAGRTWFFALRVHGKVLIVRCEHDADLFLCLDVDSGELIRAVDAAVVVDAPEPASETDGAEPPSAPVATKDTGDEAAPTDAGEGYVPGLAAEYFNGIDRDPVRLVTRRLDAEVDFDWAEGSPMEGVAPDRFSARWDGDLRIPADGEYRFQVLCDDAGGLLVGDAPPITRDGTLRLEAGWTPIRVVFVDRGGAARIALRWSGPGLAETTIDRSHLRTRADWETRGIAHRSEAQPPDAAATALPGQTGMPGQWAPGLVCEVFDDLPMMNRTASRIDRGIAYHFGACGPDLGAKPDSFVMRWTGWIAIPTEGEYRFHAEADDFMTATVGGKLVLDRSHGLDHSPPTKLEVGLHPIRVIFGEQGGRASALLHWSGPGLSQRVVPDDYFFHRVPDPGVAWSRATLVQGLEAEYYAGTRFERRVAASRVSGIDFDAGDGRPVTACPQDRFSVRMKGRFLAHKDGEHSFRLESDGSARFVLDGTTVVEKSPGGAAVTGRVELKSGFHALAVEYSHTAGKAWLRVRHDEPAGNVDEFREVYPWLLYREPPEPEIVDRRGIAPGLVGTFYRGAVPGGAKPLLERTDPVIEFDSSRRPLAPGVAAAPISAVWRGLLVVPAKGVYEFHINTRGGVRLKVGSRMVVDTWSGSAGREAGKLSLRPGRVPFLLAYVCKTGAPEIRVDWVGPGFDRRTIGAGALAHKSATLPVVASAEGRAAPSASVTRAASRASGRNLAVNGGFEAPGRDARSAQGWTAHQWGERDRTYSVRVDRSHQHSGDRALVVRAFQDGALPGAFSRIALSPGRYEVSYWACCEVGKQAHARVHLAGEDLPVRAVGDEWKRFAHTVTVKDRQPAAGLKFWITTAAVRVWFDDIEVRKLRQ